MVRHIYSTRLRLSRESGVTQHSPLGRELCNNLCVISHTKWSTTITYGSIISLLLTFSHLHSHTYTPTPTLPSLHSHAYTPPSLHSHPYTPIPTLTRLHSQLYTPTPTLPHPYTPIPTLPHLPSQQGQRLMPSSKASAPYHP